LNVLNRILSILVLVGVVAAAAVTLGLVWDFLTVAAVRRAWPYPPVERVTYDVAHLSHGTVYWVVGGSLVVGLLALVLLVRELTPPPRRARLLVLPGKGPGRTEVPYRALDELAERSAQEVAGIERVRARVEPRRRALTVRCRALVSPYADLATAAPELQRTITDRLHHVTGLPVRAVRVRTIVQQERARRRVR
jgi:hypothetical protein